MKKLIRVEICGCFSDTFEGPLNTIQERFDKLIEDYKSLFVNFEIETDLLGFDGMNSYVITGEREETDSELLSRLHVERNSSSNLK